MTPSGGCFVVSQSGERLSDHGVTFHSGPGLSWFRAKALSQAGNRCFSQAGQGLFYSHTGFCSFTPGDRIIHVVFLNELHHWWPSEWLSLLRYGSAPKQATLENLDGSSRCGWCGCFVSVWWLLASGCFCARPSRILASVVFREDTGSSRLSGELSFMPRFVKRLFVF